MAVGRVSETASTRFNRKLESKKNEELSDLKELFLFTLGIVSWRKKFFFFLLHRKTEENSATSKCGSMKN